MTEIMGWLWSLRRRRCQSCGQRTEIVMLPWPSRTAILGSRESRICCKMHAEWMVWGQADLTLYEIIKNVWPACSQCRHFKPSRPPSSPPGRSSRRKRWPWERAKAQVVATRGRGI